MFLWFKKSNVSSLSTVDFFIIYLLLPDASYYCATPFVGITRIILPHFMLLNKITRKD